MLMPWGKFKGHEITSLPSSYLLWLAENIDEKKSLNKIVCLAADEEYQYREKNNCHVE